MLMTTMMMMVMMMMMMERENVTMGVGMQREGVCDCP